MRIRSTKPEFWSSRTVCEVEWEHRFVLKGLESYVDDNGVGKDDIELICGDVWKRDLARDGSRTLARVSAALNALHQAGLIWRYEVDGEPLLFVSCWESIQKIDRPSAGRFPRPDGTWSYGESQIRECVASPREGSMLEQGNRGTEEQVFLVPDSADAEPEDEPKRDDVEAICDHLQERLVANGRRNVAITKAWRREARLLIDRDGRDAAEVHQLIDWCQNDPFWKANIGGLPKFREKYDQLRLKAGARITGPTADGPAVMVAANGTQQEVTW